MTLIFRFYRALACATTALLLFVPALRADVAWMTWDDDAKAAAQARNVPIYLHIADPLNELSGAMAEQTFANTEVGEFLNEHFVCVRVERDHVPGLAGYGQQWLAADQKLAGWPLNLWFTPEMAPIEGASYLPPTEEWGREGFMVVAGRVAERWGADPDAVRSSAENTAYLISDYLPFAAAPVDDMAAALQTAAEDWLALLNREAGVFGEAPHRLEPELLRFLIQQGPEERAAALAVLRTRAESALRDPIDGGFYRATADSAGGIPVFQKRLTDQARVALAFLDAAAVDEDPVFAATATGVLDYVVARLSSADTGLLILGEDATGAGEATTQSWAWEELVALVGEETASALGATEAGNVDADEDLEGHHSGKNVLKASVLTTASPSMLQALTKLHKARTNRHDARVDSVATAGAHGLILHAFRRSAAELENSDHGAVAEQIELALREKFGVGTETFSRIAGADVLATPEDYVLVGLGLGDNAMADEADQRFFDDELGLYYVTVEPVLEVRPLWWPSSPGDLPAPTVWRVASGGAPELMVAEIAAPFENPDMPPAGAVLLALKLANED